MPQITAKNRDTITIASSHEDDSDLQLAAMVLALRDSHVTLFAELTHKPAREIEAMIDKAYDEYMEGFERQMNEDDSGAS